VAHDKAIVCSDQGDICLLDNSGPVPQLLKITEVKFSIQSAVICPKGYLLVGGNQGKLIAFRMNALLKFSNTEPSFTEVGSSIDTILDHSLVALGSINNLVVTLDSRRKFQFLTLSQDISQAPRASHIKQLPAHGSAVLGVQSLIPEAIMFNASYLTWSAEGLVLFWDHEGSNVGSLHTLPKESDTEVDGLSNELKMISIIQRAEILVSGDRHGWIRLVCQVATKGWLLINTGFTTFPPGKSSLKPEFILEKLLISRYPTEQTNH